MTVDSLLLRGATLLPGGTDWSPRHTDLLIRAGRITAIGSEASSLSSGAEIDARRLLILPAFDNAHTHSPEVLARGRAPLSRQAAWLAEAYAGGIDALDSERIGRAVRSLGQELAQGGTTAVTDHFRQIPQHRAAVLAAVEAWRETGLRARVAVMLRDRALPPGTAAYDLSTILALATECLALGGRDVAVGLGPSAPQRCSTPLLTGLGRLVREAKSFLHLHVCETAADAASCRSLYGESAITHLDRLGLLGPATELAHCVHVDDDDLRRLAATGTVMIHNPAANLRLGSGLAPIARALTLGVRLRLGTDGAGSNDCQSMLDTVRLACLLPRNTLPEAEWPMPSSVLAMATAGARIEVGAATDLLAFDLDAPAFLDATDAELVPRLALAARETDLAFVLQGGCLAESRRRPSTFMEERGP
jgi:guanine deaminase